MLGKIMTVSLLKLFTEQLLEAKYRGSHQIQRASQIRSFPSQSLQSSDKDKTSN